MNINNIDHIVLTVKDIDVKKFSPKHHHLISGKISASAFEAGCR
jgi:hypothetical protein